MSTTDPLVRGLVDLVVRWEAGGARQPVVNLDHPTWRARGEREARLSAVLAAARAVDATHGHGGSVIDAAVALAGALRALRDALAAADGAA